MRSGDGPAREGDVEQQDTRAALLRRQYELEAGYADLLLASARGSRERKLLFEESYRELATFLERHAPGGAETDYTDLVVSLTQRCVPPGGRVIDIGCATGNLLCALTEAGFEASGIDVSAAFVARARERMARYGRAESVTQADVVDFEADAAFDCAVLDNVIEHMHPDSVVDVLSICCKLLKPGGYAIVLTPHRLSGPHDISKHFLPLGAKSHGLHLREYTFTELARHFSDAGFAEILGFPYHPRLLWSLGLVPRPSTWAARKAIAAERLIGTGPLARMLTLRASVSRAAVALLFPAVCIGRKAG